MKRGRPFGFRAGNRKTAEMVGKKYEMLLVLAEADSLPDGTARMRVRCDCGISWCSLSSRDDTASKGWIVTLTND
jgi:hypothetical protein